MISNLLKGDRRTVLAKKNIIASLFLKIIDVSIYLGLVPITIGYLNTYEYGIWLTLNSILMWINSFDIGFGNGLRNKLAEAIANDDKHIAKVYVSSTLYMLIFLMGIIVIFSCVGFKYIDWYSLLNTNNELVPNLPNIILVSLTFFCFNFIMKFIGNVYQALQLPAVSNCINVSGHFLSLLIIILLTRITEGNLLYVAIAYSASPTIVYLLLYPYTFFYKFKELNPSYRFVRWNHIKELCSISVQFFVLQIAGLALFSSANIIISNQLGPESVTPYNLSNRYFSLANLAISIILSPMWSATTEAYIKGDINWIKKSMKKLVVVNIFATLGVLIMLILSPIAYKIWLQDSVEIPYSLSISMSAYVVIMIWSLGYSSFLNGMGKLYIQTLNTIIIAILFIPFCVYGGKLFGLNGIVYSMCILNGYCMIINIIQFYKVINTKKQSNIWLK